MRYRVLGKIEAVATTPVTLRGKRVRTLLATLLLEHGKLVPIRHLIDTLWDADPPHTATRQVQHCVSLLRKDLTSAGAATSILTETCGYRLVLAEDDSLDLARWNELTSVARRVAVTDPAHAVDVWRRALALWRGPALADVASARLAPRADYLTDHRVTVTEEYLAARVRIRPDDDVLDELASLALAHPLRERTAELLINAFRATGRRVEALGHYRRYAATLASELGLDPSDRMKRLQRELLTDEVIVSTPTSCVPGELPGSPPGFIGRTRQLAELTRQAETGRSRVIVIQGLAGSGKTSLALRFAHTIRHRYPDGQLHIDLRGNRRGDRMPVADALARLMRSLGASTPESTDTDELAGRYRTLVGSRRLLLVLDNAADAEQVLPLLPGNEECLVVVTSHRDLSLVARRTDAMTTTPEPLTPTEATAMLRGFLDDSRGEDEEALASLATLCDCHPAALRLAGERLRRHSTREVADLVRLMSEGNPLDWLSLPGDPGVRAAFDQLLDDQTETARAVWLALAESPVFGWSAQTASVVLGMSEAAARRELNALAAAHLLVEDDNGDYRFRRLTRLYAVDRARAVGAEKPDVDRLLSWYSARIAEASTLAGGHAPEHDGWFTDPADAARWLERESANIRACVEYAARRDAAPPERHRTRAVREAFRELFLDTGRQRRRIADAQVTMLPQPPRDKRPAEAGMLAAPRRPG